MKILITGSTDGIGKLAAQELAAKGHHVILHGRNPQKVSSCIDEIKQSVDDPSVDGVVADFSDLNQVIRISEEIIKNHPDLDVLINNAGIFKCLEPMTQDGLDVRFVVNYLAPYLLTDRLIPLFEKRSDSRIINLSSAAQAYVDHDALLGNAQPSMSGAYAQSKLALTMWSFDLAKRIKHTSVIAVNPGSLLQTKMVMEAYGQFRATADKGSNLLVDLAISDEFDGVSGKYFDNDLGHPRGQFGQAHPDAYDADLIEQLMKTTNMLIDKLTG